MRLPRRKCATAVPATVVGALLHAPTLLASYEIYWLPAPAAAVVSAEAARMTAEAT